MEKVQVKLTNRSASGTSFHGHTVEATYNELKQVLGGDAQYTDADKSNYDFVGVCDATNAGIVFTVYDWKLPAFGKDQTVEWHIGLHNGSNGSIVRAVIERELDVVRRRKQIIDVFEKKPVITNFDGTSRIEDLKEFLSTKLGVEPNKNYVLVPKTDDAPPAVIFTTSATYSQEILTDVARIYGHSVLFGTYLRIVKNARKQTLREKLVARLDPTRGYKYSEIVAHLLKLNYGESRECDWKSNDRGYYAAALQRGGWPYYPWANEAAISGGYLVNGSGACGLQRNHVDGLYYVKHYTLKDQMLWESRRFNRALRRELDRSMRRYESFTVSKDTAIGKLYEAHERRKKIITKRCEEAEANS